MEFTKGDKVFVPDTGAVYMVTEITHTGELYLGSRGVYGWRHDRILFDPTKVQVIPLDYVLAASAMLEALKEIKACPMPWALRHIDQKDSTVKRVIQGMQNTAKAAIAQACPDPDGK